MIKVSVIIPVYNAKDYLRRCLDSVCNQTLKDIEIICVNDCSTDNSLEILQEYAQKDTRIHVIDCKKNGGESAARNIGLDNATGEYIGFVDNDDEIDLEFYEKLYIKAKETNADIAKGEAHIIDYNGKESYGNLNQKIRENNSILYFVYYWWTAIYSSSIIKENSIRFIEGYPLGGDVLFLNEIILLSNSFVLVDSVFYHYYQRKDSGNSEILSFEKIKSVLNIHEMIVDNILQSPKFKSFSSSAIDFIFSLSLTAALTYCYRYKTIEVLDFCMEKAFSVYKKVAPYIQKNSIQIGSTCIENLENGDVNQLKQFFIINDSPKKKLFANLRSLYFKRNKI